MQDQLWNYSGNVHANIQHHHLRGSAYITTHSLVMVQKKSDLNSLLKNLVVLPREDFEREPKGEYRVVAAFTICQRYFWIYFVE